jgi:lipid II:glycine glycyltransferase (peptidoglycan interpeptide bridge formation enzyme)
VVVRIETQPSSDALTQWDALVERCPGTDVTQLSAWARVRARVGYSAKYVLAYRGKRVVGGALVLWRRLAGPLTVGYLPYGPLVDPAAEAPVEVAAALVEQLARLGAELTALFVQPPEGAQNISEALLARGFRPSQAGIAPAGSYRVDLGRPLEEIRAGFSKRLKSWTNRWEAKGVRVRLGDERDLPVLVELMAHTGVRQGFTPPSVDYVRTLYRELVEGGHAALFVGEVNGRPVSADVVSMVGGMVRGRLGGFDESGESGKLSVPAAVRWEIIKWGKERGYRWLDFGGLPEQMLADMIDRSMHTSEEWPNAHRGKLAFNGSAFRYPTPVELIRSAALRRCYDLTIRHPVGRRAVAAAKGLLRGTAARGDGGAADMSRNDQPGAISAPGPAGGASRS